MADFSQKDLVVVIVSWNVKDHVLENLKALYQSQGLSFDVVVVDNASADGTVETVRSQFPQAIVIPNTENLGFAKACNQGIKAAPARHVLLLNPDMKVESDSLAKTVAYLDAHPDVAVLGAKLFGENGKPIHHMRRFPAIVDQLAIVLKLSHLFPKLVHRYHAIDLDLEREHEVDSVRGSYFAISQNALVKIGLLDEGYFIWFEEVDYCRQAKERGMKVMYVPSIQATDLVGKSFSQRKTYWKQKMFMRSMLRYFKKWQPTWQYVLLAAARPFGLAVALVRDALLV